MTLITISTHNGSQAHRGHNIRDERAIKNQDHIDREKGIEIWRDEKPRDAYERLFGQAVKDYNSKQTRADRRIDDYYNKIHESKKQHPVYEVIVQVGSKDNPVSADTCKEILKEYYDTWDERNPNLVLIGAYFHPDEKGEPHLHADYVPYAEYDKGLSIRTGLNKALEAQGYEKAGKATPQIQWEKSENAYLERLCRDRGIEVEHPERDKSPEMKRQHEETRIYQANKDLDRRERETAEKEREQARKGRAIDKRENDISAREDKLSKDRNSLNQAVEIVRTDKTMLDEERAEFEANKAIIEQVRATADRLKEIDNSRMVQEVPEPIGRGLHKGYYTREQVEELTKEVNKAREQARNVEKGREVSSLDERLEAASKKAVENIKDKTIERLQEENKRLQKDSRTMDWIRDKAPDKAKDWEERAEREEREREHTRTHSHDRNTPSR